MLNINLQKSLLIALSASSLLLASCELNCRDVRRMSYRKAYTQHDVLTSDVLIGTWDCANTDVGIYIFKQVTFYDDCQAAVVVEYSNGGWNTLSFTYGLSNGCIRMARNRENFSFKIVDFVWPCLTFQQTYSTISWTKVRR